jgi:hypothetical protein
MMQPVRYSTCSLAFASILDHSNRARGACCSTRLAFLLHFPQKNSPSPVLSPPCAVHCTMLCLTHSRTRTCTHTTRIILYLLKRRMFRSIGAGFGNRNSCRGDPSCPEEGKLCLWCAGGQCNGNVGQSYTKLLRASNQIVG